MILVIASVHSMRGDLFVALMFLGVIWLLGKVMWGTCTSSRYRSLKDRASAERKLTKIELPGHKDPLIVGDVSQAHWPKAHYPHSRANIAREP